MRHRPAPFIDQASVISKHLKDRIRQQAGRGEPMSELPAALHAGAGNRTLRRRYLHQPPQQPPSTSFRRNRLYLREPTPPNIRNTLKINYLQPILIVGTPLKQGYLPQTLNPKPLTTSILQNQPRCRSLSLDILSATFFSSLFPFFFSH